MLFFLINIKYLICFSRQEGGQELDVPLVVHPLRWFFGLLGRGPSILFLVFPLFWVLWFISDFQGFIKIVLKILV